MTEKKPMIILTRPSPYYLIDLQEIQKADGEKIPLDPATALCRCRESFNKALYDGASHEKS